MFNTKQDNEIMKILHVTELRHFIAHTNNGDLTLMLRKGEQEYFFVLDAVPVDKEQNEELRALFFPPKVFVPQVSNMTFNQTNGSQLANNDSSQIIKSKSKSKKK